MARRRDPILLLGAVLVLGIAGIGAVESIGRVGRPFPGFLVLGNGVVASAGLARWPAVADGEIYQAKLQAVDGAPLARARALPDRLAARPVPHAVAYTFERGPERFVRVLETRTFDGTDWVLLYGAYLFCGLGLTGAALVIRFLGRRDDATTGSVVSLAIAGVWALTALDLYGPYRLFRLHALAECFLFAGTLHFSLVFPFPQGWLRRRPWLPVVPYGAAALLAALAQATLHDAASYSLTHRVAVAAFGVSLLALIASQALAWLRAPSFEARARVKVLVLGIVGAVAPQSVLSLGSAWSGGQAAENAMGWSGVFFPLAVGYAVLRQDLLGVDAILRRTVNYVLLTAIVALAYAGSVALFESFFARSGRETRWLGVLLFGMATVWVLIPLRDRLQAVVDRTFFRAAYDFQRLVETTSARLVSVTDLAAITRDVRGVVEEALRPERIDFLVRSPSDAELRPSDAFPETALATSRASPAPLDTADGGLLVPICMEGRVVAALVMGRRLSGRLYGGDDRRLLLTLANQAALAVENALALESLRILNRDLESKVEERTTELRRALSELREAQHQLVHQEKMASVGRLVAGVAHELNNPLNFVQGNVEHLKEYTKTFAASLDAYERALSQGGGAQDAARIRGEHDLDYLLQDLDALFAATDEGVHRSLAIVHDLRSFSRLDAGTPSTIDLVEAIEASLLLLRPRLDGIRVVRDCPPELEVECLEGPVKQVLVNLVANAIDAITPPGTITVRAWSEAEKAIVEVEDDGCGIPEDALERIFEPFYTTKEVGHGTGLGLAISFGAIARHEGKLQVRSRVGAGSVFRVELPVRFAGDARGGAALG